MSFPNYALFDTPVNRVASRVRFGESETWVPKIKPSERITFDAPPRVKKKRPEATTDYTGVRRGYMTAIAWYEASKQGPRWLCRCDCGKYEFRIAKRWAKNLDKPDACVICEKTFYVANGYSLGDTRDEFTRKREMKEAANKKEVA